MKQPHPVFRWRNFGLTIVLVSMFAVSIVGQFFFGFSTYNEERRHEGLVPLTSYGEYLNTGHFVSSVAENMESEFLQMAVFVLLTVALYQKGSSESRKPPEEESAQDRKDQIEEEQYSRAQKKKNPIAWRIYENSLSLALVALFLAFFMLHARGSWHKEVEEKAAHHEPTITFLETFKEPEFWFESFQNWQSEFFSMAVLMTFGIFLRQKGSSQSKKMNDPIWKTGEG